MSVLGSGSPRWHGAPKPANFDAMSAAWNDDARLGIEIAKYRAQLVDEGYSQPRHGGTFDPSTGEIR